MLDPACLRFASYYPHICVRKLSVMPAWSDEGEGERVRLSTPHGSRGLACANYAKQTFDAACTRRASEAKRILGAVCENRSVRHRRRYLVLLFLDLAHM